MSGNFELKSGDDFIVAIDVSGSMATTDCPGGLSRFDFAMEKTRQFCKEADKVDEDGISIMTFGHQIKCYENVTLDKVEEVINKSSPIEAATRTDTAINQAWMEHTTNGNDRTMMFIITDGEPTNKPDVTTAIQEISGKIKTPHEFNIYFLTVGQRDSKLETFLNSLASINIVKVQTLQDAEFYTAIAK